MKLLYFWMCFSEIKYCLFRLQHYCFGMENFVKALDNEDKINIMKEEVLFVVFFCSPPLQYCSVSCNESAYLAAKQMKCAMTCFWRRQSMVRGTSHTLTCELAFWHLSAVFAAAARPKLYPRRGSYTHWICKGALLCVHRLQFPSSTYLQSRSNTVGQAITAVACVGPVEGLQQLAVLPQLWLQYPGGADRTEPFQKFRALNCYCAPPIATYTRQSTSGSQSTCSQEYTDFSIIGRHKLAFQLGAD